MLKDLPSFRCVKQFRGGKLNQVQLFEDPRSGQKFVLKTITIKNFEKQLNELLIHKKLSTEHVVRLLDSDFDQQCIRLLLEFAELGDLFELLPKLQRSEEKLVLDIFFAVVRAVAHLHSLGVVHRDIKPENVLLGAGFRPKLADFGTANYLSKMGSGVCGTYEYMAPEVFDQKPQSEKVDVWALGILLYEMTHAKPPFTRQELIRFKNAGTELRFTYSSELNPALRRLIESLLQKNPEKRPTCEEILANSLFEACRRKEEKKTKLIKSESEKFLGQRVSSKLKEFLQSHNENQSLNKLASMSTKANEKQDCSLKLKQQRPLQTFFKTFKNYALSKSEKHLGSTNEASQKVFTHPAPSQKANSEQQKNTNVMSPLLQLKNLKASTNFSILLSKSLAANPSLKAGPIHQDPDNFSEAYSYRACKTSKGYLKCNRTLPKTEAKVDFNELLHDKKAVGKMDSRSLSKFFSSLELKNLKLINTAVNHEIVRKEGMKVSKHTSVVYKSKMYSCFDGLYNAYS